MGTLRAQYDASGAVINGVTLGEPVVVPDQEDPEPIWEWDDGLLPEGELIPTGEVLFAEESA